MQHHLTESGHSDLLVTQTLSQPANYSTAKTAASAARQLSSNGDLDKFLALTHSYGSLDTGRLSFPNPGPAADEREFQGNVENAMHLRVLCGERRLGYADQRGVPLEVCHETSEVLPVRVRYRLMYTSRNKAPIDVCGRILDVQWGTTRAKSIAL